MEKYRNQLTYMPVHIGTLYGYTLLSLEWLGRYTEEEEWLKKAFAEPLNKLDAMEVCLVFYDMMGARTYGYLNEDERCISYFQRYIGSQKKVKMIDLLWKLRRQESSLKCSMSYCWQKHL